MKKFVSLLLCAVLSAALLAGCGGSSSSAGSVGDGTGADSMAVEPATSEPADAPDSAPAGSAEAADTAKLDAIVAALEAVNEVPNPRAYDDFTLEMDLLLTMDNIVDFKGDVTNNGDDCALVLAIQAKDGCADAVKSELEAARDAMAGNDLYVEFADKVAKAQDARVVSEGNFVVFVISGVNGPDYAEIDSAITAALAA